MSDIKDTGEKTMIHEEIENEGFELESDENPDGPPSEETAYDKPDIDGSVDMRSLLGSMFGSALGGSMNGSVSMFADRLEQGLPEGVFRDLAMLVVFHNLMLTRKDNSQKTFRGIMDTVPIMTARLVTAKVAVEEAEREAAEEGENGETDSE